MNTPSISSSRTASLLAASLFCMLTPAQGPGSAARLPNAPAARLLPAPDLTGRLHVGETDGAIWARGRDWKASFAAASGFTFIPFLGSQQPHNHPLQVRLAGVQAGGVPVPLALEVAPARAAEHRIEFARGGVIEAYELRSPNVEQLFVVPEPLGAGALTVRMQVTSGLVGAADAHGGLSFTCEAGGVSCSRTIAFDAAQRRVDVESRLDGDVLTLTVPAAFAASARYPLTIDPIYMTLPFDSGNAFTASITEADTAYLGTHTGLYATVYEELYSAADHDIYVSPYDRDGAPRGGEYVDYTTQNWVTPRIASHRGASQFLVVATRITATSSFVHARQLTYDNHDPWVVLTMALPFQLAAGGRNPDVGGDAHPSPLQPGTFGVTWEGAGNGELYYNVVRTDGTLLTPGGTLLTPGPEVASNATISKSCGLGALATRGWIIVWQKTYSAADEDIYGTRIGVDGTVQTAAFLIDYSSLSDSNPEVSSLADLSGGHERFLVVYQRAVPPIPGLALAHDDIVGNLFSGTGSLSGPTNLTSLFNMVTLRGQRNPCVDTDGTRFAVGFGDHPQLFLPDAVPYLGTLHVTPGNTLAVTSYPESLSPNAWTEDHLRITSERSGGTSSPRYMAVWDQSDPVNGTIDVRGAFYFGHSNLLPSSYFNNALPGCGAMMLSPVGLPALGSTFTLQLVNPQGFGFLLFGTSIAPLTVCPGCLLGVDPATMLVVPSLTTPIAVPNNVGLINAQVAAQGLDLLATGACTQPFPFALSNVIIVTIL